jgi:hypothetical protein
VSTAAIDPRWALRAGTMSAFQVGIITVCVLIAGLDGFDVLVVAFTATVLANEWMLSPSALGVPMLLAAVCLRWIRPAAQNQP